jgi:hypothetical protein
MRRLAFGIMMRPIVLLSVLGTAFVAAALWARGADPAEKAPVPVLSMRVFALRPGVKAEDFEGFVRTELADAVGKESGGMKMHIFKGDRGTRKGAYILVWEFDSVSTRNQYFPREGRGSGAAFDEIWQRIKGAMSKFNRYVQEEETYTDYVAVTK